MATSVNKKTAVRDLRSVSKYKSVGYKKHAVVGRLSLLQLCVSVPVDFAVLLGQVLVDLVLLDVRG